jgi:hypothetical protein
MAQPTVSTALSQPWVAASSQAAGSHKPRRPIRRLAVCRASARSTGRWGAPLCHVVCNASEIGTYLGEQYTEVCANHLNLIKYVTVAVEKNVQLQQNKIANCVRSSASVATMTSQTPPDSTR